MTSDIKQLTDIVVDWVGVDLARGRLANLGSDTAAVEEMLNCLLFTLGRDPIAKELFEGLLKGEVERAGWGH